jgi:hypothetical protein
MAKARIVMDVETDLKTHFGQRIEMLDDELTVTTVLRFAMYRMLMMDNRQLERFVNLAREDFAGFRSYLAFLANGKKSGIVPDDFPVANSRVREVKDVLIKHELEEIDDVKARGEIAMIEDLLDVGSHRDEWERQAAEVPAEAVEEVVQKADE